MKVPLLCKEGRGEVENCTPPNLPLQRGGETFGAMMKIEIVMPQMGESVAEGTVVTWLKKAGEPV